jgi:trigger factor
MKVTVEKQPNSMVKLTIVVEADLFNHGLDHAFEEEVQKVEVKGFRKGKVPRATFEKMFGIERLYEKAINHTINHTYGEALDQSNIVPVAPPHIDVDMNNLGKDKPMTYFVDVAVKPEVTLGDVEGIKVTRIDTAILDGDVEAELEHRLSHKSELVTKQGKTLAQGDTAIFDFTGYLNGEEFEGGKAENHQLKIGSGQFIPGFEEGMIGLSIGESRDVPVTFPAEYQAPHLAGQPVVFKVVLHEIKETVLPELTADLIKELGKEATTKDELLAELRREMEVKHSDQAKNQLIDSVVRRAATTATVDIPHDMIHAEMDRMMDDVTRQAKQYNIELEMFLQFQGTSLEQYKHDLHQRAEDQLRYSLVLEEIANSRNLKPSEAKIEETYADIAKQYKMDLAKVKEALTVEGLTEQLKTQLAVDYLIEHSAS